MNVFTLPCSLDSAGGFLTVRSRGASWSAMRSLVRTGFWLSAVSAAKAAGLVGGGAPECKGWPGGLWSGWGMESVWLFWGKLVFEVYSPANWLIIIWRISAATIGMRGSEKLGMSKGKQKKKTCFLKKIYEQNLNATGVTRLTNKAAFVANLIVWVNWYNTQMQPQPKGKQTHLFCGKLHWESLLFVSRVCWLRSDL